MNATKKNDSSDKRQRLTFALTNARSLPPKAESFSPLFDDLRLDFVVVTEPWFSASSETREFLDRASGEFGIASVDRMRKKNPNNNNNPSSLRRAQLYLKNIKSKEHSLRLFVPEENCTTIRALSLSTKLKAKGYHQCLTLVSEAILKIKSEVSNPYIAIMGDLNNKDVNEAIGDYDDIQVINTAATRGSSCLDITATSFNDEILKSHVIAPLVNDNGVPSDHRIVVHEAELRHQHSFKWIRYSARRHTAKGWEEFDKCIKGTDWCSVLPLDPNDRVTLLHQNITAIKDRCFPLAFFKIRSTDDPWVDEAVRKKIQQRRDAFQTAGGVRTASWRALKSESNKMIVERKAAYYKKECDKLTQPGANKISNKALRIVTDAEKTKMWTVHQLKPDMSCEEIAEDLADFFASISQTFPPVEQREDTYNI